MIQIEKVKIKDENIKLTVNVTDAETLSFGGRIVKLDFGTLTVVDLKEVELASGSNTVNLTIMNYDNLPRGSYAVFFNTIFNSENASLSDEGPYNFEKETDEQPITL